MTTKPQLDQRERSRELQHALHEIYDPQDPIATEPGDLEDEHRSTEAGMGFVLALVAIAVVALSATVIALWPVPEQAQQRAVAGVVR